MLAALLLAGVTATGCKPKMVDVQSGTQVLCTYGEVVSEQVETLKVPAKDASKYSVETTTVTCDIHKKVEALYAAAQTAIAKGDLKTARAKLDEALRLDPAYRNAREQAEAIDKGQTPPAPGGGTSASPTSTPVGPVVNLVKYVPDTIAGYSAQAVSPDILSISRVYLPSSGGDIAQLVIQAEQFKDAAQAASKMSSSVKSSYPQSAATLKVGGRDAYFGTNGRGYAAIGLTDGAALVIFEMYSRSGKPLALKSAITAVAEAVL